MYLTQVIDNSLQRDNQTGLNRYQRTKNSIHQKLTAVQQSDENETIKLIIQKLITTILSAKVSQM